MSHLANLSATLEQRPSSARSFNFKFIERETILTQSVQDLRRRKFVARLRILFLYVFFLPPSPSAPIFLVSYHVHVAFVVRRLTDLIFTKAPLYGSLLYLKYEVCAFKTGHFRSAYPKMWCVCTYISRAQTTFVSVRAHTQEESAHRENVTCPLDPAR
ncbi:hypothetical protein BJ165DRAFT_1405244 [Panaeolus papilionaceus]|nr:hypothetical protein BJ165DRAFT_1405244 [Panaeolus papilionaceus]